MRMSTVSFILFFYVTYTVPQLFYNPSSHQPERIWRKENRDNYDPHDIPDAALQVAEREPAADVHQMIERGEKGDL